MFNNILIGADPEVFVTDPEGVFISAGNMVNGTKEEPEAVAKGAVQVDGMALEFNIEPASNVNEFVDNVASVYAQLRSMVPPGVKFSDKCTAKFDEAYFKARPESEKVLGCESDFNAYTGGKNAHPNASTPMRTAGGHIHIGWREPTIVDDQHERACKEVVRACDLFLGLPSVLFDNDTERRSMYGKAGAYRPKAYGVEYRTLSNAWLHSQKLQELLYSNIDLMFSREAEWSTVDYGKVIQAINTSDRELALDILKQHDVPYLEV